MIVPRRVRVHSLPQGIYCNTVREAHYCLVYEFREVVELCLCFQSESYQDDIYPMTPGNRPALTAEEWLGGVNKGPKRCVLECV